MEGPKDPNPALEPYWGAIGQAVIAVNPVVTSVFLKASAVTGEFRTRDLTCIAGPDASETIHKENDCSFYLDLRKVFFSPRLVTERARVAHIPKLEDELVLDMFAGVGPFAIQRAKVQGVPVIAVDKNPVAVEYLQRNVQVNHVANLVTSICDDVAHLGQGNLSDIVHRASRIIMNLPERAFQFLPQAVQALRPNGGIIHFYQFTRESDPLETSSRKFIDALQTIKGELVRIDRVKIVKPYAPHEYLTVVDAFCRPSFSK
ncbi:MAG: putative SAM-dependent methyltransferase [Promethearchaeota archaeon CR_4]|nr:MAG: putative SAM-dependent methyltransferase [Candidatus Lokiarchaeota archaeon CR_4]